MSDLAQPLTLDAPGVQCRFDSYECSTHVLGHGGFDLHHPIPIELGGPEDQERLPHCPNHHRRQHSLIRYFWEACVEGVKYDWDVLKHFTSDERKAALAAVEYALNLDPRPEPQWNVAAARAV